MPSFRFITFPYKITVLNYFHKCFCSKSECWVIFETDAPNDSTTEIYILAFLIEYWRNSWRYSERRWASITTTNFRIIIWFFENIIINPNVTDKTTSLIAFYIYRTHNDKYRSNRKVLGPFFVRITSYSPRSHHGWNGDCCVCKKFTEWINLSYLFRYVNEHHDDERMPPSVRYLVSEFTR